jgi:hypothetical protein
MRLNQAVVSASASVSEILVTSSVAPWEPRWCFESRLLALALALTLLEGGPDRG